MDDSQTKSLAGLPGLAQIPILRYLFGQVSQDHSSDETVFAITPHIIRGTSLSEMNQRAIDIGTATQLNCGMSTIRPQRRCRLLKPPRIRLRRPSCRRINSRTSSPLPKVRIRERRELELPV